jgi:hypothetical protein
VFVAVKVGLTYGDSLPRRVNNPENNLIPRRVNNPENNL